MRFWKGKSRTEKAGLVLHLDLQLFSLWEVEEVLALFDNVLYQCVVNASVLNVEEADVQ